MFIGDFGRPLPGAPPQSKGCKRFVDRYWSFRDILIPDKKIRDELLSSFHKTIKKVTHDIDNLKMNTEIAALMALMNEISETLAR